MTDSRRNFFKKAIGAGLLGMVPVIPGCDRPQNNSTYSGLYDPMRRFTRLQELIPDPLVVESVELRKIEGQYFVITRSTAGDVGIVKGNQRLENTLTLFSTLVVPFFIGRDARNIEDLVDEVYLDARNYKFTGMPFWNAVGHVELSLLDMMGKILGQPVADLFGGMVHDEIPVYLSSMNRHTSPEEEIELVSRRLAETGARAVKLKIGGRMSRNKDSIPGRSEELIRLSREKLGEDIELYFDANGSYDVPKAIEMGRLLEEIGAGFYEEPLPWEDFEGTKMVADALDMAVAGGEQDSNLFLFQWMIANKGFDIVQPDIFYNGGFTRCMHVASMAQAMGLPVTPHSPKNDPTGAANLQFCATIPNLGPYQEYLIHEHPRKEWYQPYLEINNGKIKVSRLPGLGIEYDEAYLLGGERIL